MHYRAPRRASLRAQELCTWVATRCLSISFRVRQANELKLDRALDFRRRLAAAAHEARNEINSQVLCRRLHQSLSPSPAQAGRRQNRRQYNNGAVHPERGDVRMPEGDFACGSRGGQLLEVRILCHESSGMTQMVR